jgi:signal transduction histidine kinase
MLLIGIWVADQIENGVVQSIGTGAALHTDSLIGSRLQELKNGDQLSLENKSALDRLVFANVAGKSLVAFHIWKGDKIVYSSNRQLIGLRFPSTAVRDRAWSGTVSVEFNSLSEPDEAAERALKLPLLEIYAPVRESGTDRIIALAETYEVVPNLEEQIKDARFSGWLVVLVITLHMLVLQAAVVRQGSTTIEKQQDALNDKIRDLSILLKDNEALRLKSKLASQRVAEMNERYARQLGADLHDGPVQLLGMSLLRLDSLSQIINTADSKVVSDAEEDLVIIREALTETLQEIRSVSKGLAPPNIEGVTLHDALEMACRMHARRTGSPVKLELAELPANAPHTLKTCLYRFAQEGLNNATRHAQGKGQVVTASCKNNVIEVTVADSGPGLKDTGAVFSQGGSGLIGMRDRIEALGGEFSVVSSPVHGTRLKAKFVIENAEAIRA